MEVTPPLYGIARRRLQAVHAGDLPPALAFGAGVDALARGLRDEQESVDHKEGAEAVGEFFSHPL